VARIRALPLPRIHELLTMVAQFEKTGEGGTFVEASPPRNVAPTLMARGCWPGIPVLYGISRWPIFRVDGSLCTKPGYDSTTGLLYEPTCDVRVPESPSRDDARLAIELLLDLLVDFPFVDRRVHETAWLATLLAIVGRAAIDGPVPLLLIDASDNGSGKTLLADLLAAIVLGKAAPRRTKPESPEEWKKAMLSLALAALPLVLLDNVTGTLQSDALDAVLTGTEFQERALGGNEETTQRFHSVFAVTANNALISEDLVRRSLQVRLEPGVERPEQRTDYRHPELLRHALARRAELLGSALTVLRAYFVAGCPKVPMRPMGSYEEWSRVVRAALIWAGQPDVAVTQDELRDSANEERTDASMLLRAWHAYLGEAPTTLADLVDDLARVEIGQYPRKEALRLALSTICPAPEGKLPTSRKLGYRIRALTGKVMPGGFVLRRGKHGDRGIPWRVEQVSPTNAERGESSS
ncbi:MAG TPA: hypothetical protein VG963_00330, partial [Polyangiaceae bacterium]|nr:hypothetical protein [Polyangiaceae bacterium]